MSGLCRYPGLCLRFVKLCFNATPVMLGTADLALINCDEVSAGETVLFTEDLSEAFGMCRHGTYQTIFMILGPVFALVRTPV